jgi:exopolysaccharide biosynthesis protein
MPMIRFTVVAALACALSAVPALARAAQLSDVTLSKTQYYIEIKLVFDARPGYDESFRFNPDRYLLTFNKCKSAVPKAKIAALESIEHNLLTRISVYQGGENVSAGFYLNQFARPFIRTDEQGYTLRFYTAAKSERAVQLATGVSYAEKTSVYQGQNYALYIVRIDPGAPVKLYSVAADHYDSKTRLRAPGSFARREDALVVINGGFFGKRGEHLSTLVESGVMRASGVYPTRPMLVVTADGRALIGRYNVITALKFAGKMLPVNAKNYPFQNGKVMVYDATYPLDTLPQQAMFYYLLRNHQLSYYGTATKGLTLTEGTLLLATDIMPEVNPLKQVPDGAAVELETRITDSAGQTVLAHSAIGGAPLLVENGAVELSVAQDKVQPDIAKSERSRTAVGVTQSGQLILAVVKELEDAGYGGMTLKALAKLLLDEGAVTAMNLDGGGSSAIVVAGQVLNEDEPAQRPVSNVLVVKEQPVVKQATGSKQ